MNVIIKTASAKLKPEERKSLIYRMAGLILSKNAPGKEEAYLKAWAKAKELSFAVTSRTLHAKLTVEAFKDIAIVAATIFANMSATSSEKQDVENAAIWAVDLWHAAPPEQKTA